MFKFLEKVSIPFKRESVSKGIVFEVLKTLVKGFNSLQTGKRIQRRGTPVEGSTQT